jgi:hypothetical protein
MKVVLSNKSKVGLGKVVVDTHNKIAKVNFTKAPVAGPLGLGDLNNVNVSGQRNGDVLVFNANTNSYIIETLPDIDGGIF